MVIESSGDTLLGFELECWFRMHSVFLFSFGVSGTHSFVVMWSAQ